MKNFLRIVMFLIIVAAVAGTTIFLTNQNDNYANNELDKISSGDIENIDNNEDILEISGEISGDNFAGEITDSGENLEITGDESGEKLEISGDEADILPEMASGENLDEISGEVSGDISSEINEEGQVA